MKHSKGFRSGTRQVLRKSPRKRGLPPISRLIYPYKVGEKANIVIEPAVHKGMPHPRFHGKTGTIVDKRGRAYVLRVRDGGKYKYIICRPEHLRPVK
ncbi:MAG: 50S ribosomal protein L21e [Candidatus Njordarchaeia archaeon]